ncbi:hypothetical protein PCCS19_40020 [Paenibacillus sp. CCS19]|uniref:hypothetical protein n=1 Tax=Paenibacillus sp. CCS19 TaxID=3158387 RepID=UPI002562F3CA|nr:hypothetical protein [Paenibacillus cellulosilyticus]GMK40946.1 hypothetical protein PCCS19_40020 [Paenibacillus cellulosilyticus]
MNKWEGAWHVAKYEWRKDRVGMGITLLFVAYMLLVSRTFYIDVWSDQLDLSVTWLVDFAQLAILPLLGFPANRTTFKAWREDCYTRRLVQWRVLPISVNQLVMGRLIQITGLLTVGVLLYFAILYGSTAHLREQLGIGAYIGYVLIWFSYSIAIASMYSLWEQGFSGKKYMIICFAFAALYLAVAAVLGANDKSVSLYLLEQLADGNWWYPVVAIVASGAAVYGFYRLTCRRLRMRSFTR